jgi:L-lactate dehydrogenase complex protein LldG
MIGHLRDRLRVALPTPDHRSMAPIGASTPVATLVSHDRSLTELFAQALEAVAGRVVVVSDEPGAVDLLIANVCEVEGIERAVVSADLECADMVERLALCGVQADRYRSVEQVAAADLGVTGAAFGIAATGSVIVDAGRAGGRCVSLLPTVHLCLLPVSRLLPTMADLLRHLGDRMPGGLPSNLVSITGPSRSADIELHMTLGVHGPRSLWVGLLP